MKQIKITKEMRSFAIECQSITLEKMYNTDSNYTGLHEPNRFYYGYLGEFVFVKWLKESNINFKYEVNANEYPDEEDFILYANNGKPITVDVKTATKPHYKNIMFPKPQAEKYTYDCYVGVRLLSDDLAQVCGYCQKKDFTLSEMMFKVPTYYKALDELNNMDRLKAGVIKDGLFIAKI